MAWRGRIGHVHPARPRLMAMPLIPARRCGPRRETGFTLVELVMVMVITGALAVVALPRMVDTNLWRLRAYSDEVLSLTASMRRLALSQRRPIVGTITASGVSFAYASGTAISSLSCPSVVSSCIAEGGSRTVTFNAGNSGSASTSTGAALTLTISDGGNYSRVLQIETETGLIRPLS